MRTRHMSWAISVHLISFALLSTSPSYLEKNSSSRFILNMINCCLNCLFDAASLIISMFVLNLANDPEVDDASFNIPPRQKMWSRLTSFSKLKICVLLVLFLIVVRWRKMRMPKKPKDGSIALFNFRVHRWFITLLTSRIESELLLKMGRNGWSIMTRWRCF